MFSIKTEGLDGAIRGLADLPPHLSQALEDVTTEAAEDIVLELYVYPPKPAHSTYQRTGTLGRNWRVVTAGFIASITNDTPYVQWVQDVRFQTAVHRRTGWKTWQDVMDERTQTIGKDLEAKVRGIAGKVG